MDVVGPGAAGVLGAAGVFNYNRKNFKYDREQRLKTEYRMQEYKVAQSKLWREDVRELISLSEYKMRVYLLVNVLLLGHVVVLWTQGRLPEATPDWLMAGLVLSAGGSFVFHLLSMWLAMHGAVAAQAYEVRLMTQLVRLPIPSWQEIEACRTAASEFEQVEAKQMFRVPYACGKQENIAGRSQPINHAVQPNSDTTPAEADTDTLPSGSTKTQLQSDPWGLERSGRGIDGLGCHYGADVADLQHVKIARQAMVHWQSYDAYARISMTIGANQLLLGISYFLLGHIMCETHNREIAVCGVALFTALSVLLIRIDITLEWWQMKLLECLMLAGPLCCCIACYWWSTPGDLEPNAANHAQIAEIFVVCAFLFHGLFILVTARLSRLDFYGLAPKLPKAFASILYLDAFGWVRAGKRRESERAAMENADQEIANGRGCEVDIPGNSPPQVLHGHLYSEGGAPQPNRPEDFAPNGSVTDMRGLPGAPSTSNLDPSTYEQTAFFDANSWLPDGLRLGQKDAPLRTDEPLRILPRQIFNGAMYTLCAVWFLAGAYHSLAVVTGQRLRSDGNGSEIGFFQRLGANPIRRQTMQNSTTVNKAIPLARSLIRVPDHMPFPKGISCDFQGGWFILHDGILAVATNFGTEGRGNMQNGAVLTWKELDCPSIAGHGVLDATVLCQRGHGACEALFLRRDGRSLETCRLPGQAGSFDLYSGPIAATWLEEESNPNAKQLRGASVRVVALSESPVDAVSQSAGLVLATAGGRVAQFHEGSIGGRVVPTGSYSNEQLASTPPSGVAVGMFRKLDDQHFVLMGKDGRKLLVLDAESNALVGSVTLPDALRVTGFCVGGGSLYLLDVGTPNQKGGVWRFTLPKPLKGHYDLFPSA